MTLVIIAAPSRSLPATAKEAIGAAARLGGGPAALLIGAGAQSLAPEVIKEGAGTVHVANDPALAMYQPDAFLRAAEGLVPASGPSVIILSHDDVAKDLAPKLAFRLKAGLVMDCTALRMEGDALLATKPVYGGNALAEYEIVSPLKVVTLRARAFEPLPDDPQRQGSIVPVSIGLDPDAYRVRVLETKREPSSGAMRLEDAPVVVAGGRGLGNAAAFKQLEELAGVLGGAVGATRAVCDAGWVPHALQVGLTGKTVAPNLYIAVGISGASQHMAGCAGARTIVAINRDRGSNIFKEARFGVAGNWEEVLPAFTAAVKELRKG